MRVAAPLPEDVQAHVINGKLVGAVIEPPALLMLMHEGAFVACDCGECFYVNPVTGDNLEYSIERGLFAVCPTCGREDR